MISLDAFPTLSIQVGLACLAAQTVLSAIFAYAVPGDGPWKQQPGFTAHQLVCFPLMVYLTLQGLVAWWYESDEAAAAGTEGRIFGTVDRGYQLSATVLGMMVFWDIPCSIVVPALQDTLMLGHHIGMCFVAGVSVGIFSSDGHPIGTYYTSFFLGVIEFSTIFLVVVDVFHPRNAAWHAWINQTTNGGGNVAAVKFARAVNEALRPLFAVAFITVRCLWFSYVIFSTCLMDFVQAAQLPQDARHGASSLVLYGVAAIAFAFNCLQLNWGFLVAKQIAKALGLVPDKKSGSRKKPDDKKAE